MSRHKVKFCLQSISKKTTAAVKAPLCLNSILNTRKIHFLQFQCQKSILGVWSQGKKILEFTRCPSEFTANQCWPIGPCGQICRHCLAGISEGHHGKGFFFFQIWLPVIKKR